MVREDEDLYYLGLLHKYFYDYFQGSHLQMEFDEVA
jgi:hypothetical protein